jgi:hypothetical protein
MDAALEATGRYLRRHEKSEPVGFALYAIQNAIKNAIKNAIQKP